MPLTLAEATRLISGARGRAGQLDIRITVAVVDEGGLLVALERMDGAPPLSPQIAEAKAVGASMLHRDGASLAELAKDRPGFLAVADRPVARPLGPRLGAGLLPRAGRA